MNSNAIAAKQKSDSAFMKRGVIFAVMSGVTYGLYTAFLTLGQASGIWGADWYGANEAGSVCFRNYLYSGISGLCYQRYHQWYLVLDCYWHQGRAG